MRSSVLMFLFVFGLAAPGWALTPSEIREAALGAMAEGDAARAVKRLKSLKAPTDADRCALGRALLNAERPAEAAEVLAQVPETAACGRRAAFDRADALLASGDAVGAEQIYARLGAESLGPDRDRWLAERVFALADTLRARPDRGRHDESWRLNDFALDLTIDAPTRVALAERMVSALLADDKTGSAWAAARWLLWGADLDPETLARVARLSGAETGLRLLQGAPDLPAVREARAALLSQWDPRSLDAFIKGANDPKTKAAHEAWLAEQRRSDVIEPLLAQAAEPDTKQAVRALRLLAAPMAAAGRDQDWVARVIELMPKHPTEQHALRALVAEGAERAAQAALARGDFAAARTHFDLRARYAEAPDDRTTARRQAALTALAMGDLSDARIRFEAMRQADDGDRVLATEALVHLRLAQHTVAQVRAWLTSLGADADLPMLQKPALAIHTERQAPEAPAKVRLRTRNLTTVSVRLHRIDAEAFMRGGGTPEALRTLDVAVVAPDRKLTVELDAKPGQLVDTPVDLGALRPGVYRVTAGGAEIEASAVLWVTDLDLVAHAVGNTVVAGVFSKGKPVKGATVTVLGQAKSVEVETDRDGLARVAVEPGPLRLLATRKGRVALGELGVQLGAPKQTLSLGLDLGRFQAQPGELLGFRLVARQGGLTPVSQRFEVAFRGLEGAPIQVETDARGLAHGEIRVPPLGKRTNRRFELVARPVNAEQDAPHASATVNVVPAAQPSRWLTLDFEGRQAIVTAFEPNGRPAANVTLDVSDAAQETVVTDARGRAVIDGPAARLPWSPTVAIPGGPAIQSARPQKGLDLPLRLTRRRIGLGQQPSVRLGRGESRSVLVRTFTLQRPPEAADPLPRPWTLDLGPDARKGPEGLPEPYRGAGAGWTRAGAKGVALNPKAETTVELGTLPEGWWAIDAIEVKGQRRSAEPQFVEVVGRDQLYLSGVDDALPGDTLHLEASQTALVIAEGHHGLLAAAVTRGKPLDWAVTPAWRGPVTLTAISARTGEVVREQIQVDARLTVKVEVEEAPDGWAVEAHVSDARGRPVAAQVALSAYDDRLSGRAAEPQSAAAAGVRPSTPIGAWLRVFELRDAALGARLSGRLLAERERVAEDKKAQRAGEGRFQSRVTEFSFEELAVQGEMTGRGMGFGGIGSGGGGSGRGRLRRSGDYLRRAPQPRGDARRVLWAVGESDAEGTLRVVLPRPRSAAAWRLVASAATASAHGRAVERFSPTQPWLAPQAVSPGLPGAQINPSFVVHGALDDLEVVVGEARVPVGADGVVQLATQTPGARLDVRLERKGEVVDTLVWQLPVARPEARADGAVVEVAVDAGGGLPLATLALADRRMPTPLRAARLGRAAWATLEGSHASQRQTLEATVREAHRALLAEPPRSAVAKAEAVLFRSEARALLGLPDAAVRRLGNALPAPGPDPVERALMLRARAAAGAKVSPGALARLRRAELRGAARAHLGHVLASQGSRDAAVALADGDDVWAAALRRRLDASRSNDAEAVLAGAPPLPGDAALIPWLRALSRKAGRAKGTATIQVDGQPRGTLDLGAGGLLRLVAPASAKIAVEGAPEALITRRGAPSGRLGQPPVRWLAGPDGLPMNVGGDRARCGEPCVLGVGDALALPERPRDLGWTPPAPFTLERRDGAWMLRAVSPGRGVLQATGAEHHRLGDLVVEVQPTRLGAADLSPKVLDPATAITRARHAAAVGEPAGPWLAKFSEAEWAGFAAEAASLRLIEALRTGAKPEALVDAFEAARELEPSGKIAFADIARIAAAYRTLGKHARAVQVWRAGLSGAFLAEAAAASGIEEIAGRLSNARLQRTLIDRYPAVPAVGRSLFHLPQHLDALLAEEALPPELVEMGITPTDLRLLAADWDRAYLAGWPEGKEAAEAGFHLVRVLMHLRADEAAARWAKALARRHADSPMVDGLLYLQGLALARAGQSKKALKLFEQVAEGLFPQRDGTQGPGESRDDARYATARVLEATGKYAEARALYAKISDNDEAPVAHEALSKVRLSAPAVLDAKGDALRLPVTSSNLKTLHLRAYRLDASALFIRDAGLTKARNLHIAGVTPAWSGKAKGNADPFAKTKSVKLPLKGDGVWLVQISGDGANTVASLVVRSDLRVAAEDTEVGRRVRVSNAKGKPVPNAQIRWALGEEIGAERTDVRGVAVLPSGAKVLAWNDDDVAWTPNAIEVGVPEYKPRRPRRMRNRRGKKKMKGIDRRLHRMIDDNKANYQEFLQQADDGVEAEML